MKVAFHSLGCKVNSYETDAMRQSLIHAGYEDADFAPGADVYVINTCTVTNVADRKSRQMLHKAKEMNPDAVVVAAGCYVQDAGEKLTADQAVDIIVGNHEKSRLPEILAEYFRNREAGKKTAVTNINRVREYDELHFVPDGEHTRAFIKVQDGCNQFCSYCMIPYVRGRVRSRRPGEVMKEIRALISRGYQEFVLTGIHISSYGLDFDFPGQNRQTPYASEARTNRHLLGLMQDVAAIPGVMRLRLGSLEPGIITEEFAAEIANIPEFCPSFHLSMQSGCDATLERMKRKYSTADFMEKCELLRSHFDRPSITTDIITGFPGETEEEFAQTVEFVRRVGFARTHIFKFSVRRGTAAERMPGQNTEKTKAARSGVLLGIDKERRAAYAESFVGETVSVLFEDRTVIDGKSMLTGYTREYVPVLMETEEDLMNMILDVVAVSVTPQGEIIASTGYVKEGA